MLHSRKKIQQGHQLQRQNRATDGHCPFCELDNSDVPIEETETMVVIKNRIAYDHFEGIPVVRHLMIVPKTHRVSISEFTDQEKLEYVGLVGKYESDEYSVYSRAVQNAHRSVEHVHTHLLLLRGPRVSRMIFVDKPYFLHLGPQRKKRTH